MMNAKIKDILYGIVIMSAGLISMMILVKVYKDYQFERDQQIFLTQEQYRPIYMMFSDDAMLKECEKHGLVYNYDDTTCVTEQEWELLEAEQEQYLKGH